MGGVFKPSGLESLEGVARLPWGGRNQLEIICGGNSAVPDQTRYTIIETKKKKREEKRAIKKGRPRAKREGGQVIHPLRGPYKTIEHQKTELTASHSPEPKWPQRKGRARGYSG